MRQIFFLLLLVIPMTSFSQTKKSGTINKSNATSTVGTLPGLKVFGIGFETTRKKYELALSKKGYKNPSKFGEYDEYIVNFSGYKDCKFDIYYNVTTDSITKIKILYPFETYEENSDAHFEIVKQLDAKYGASERSDKEADFWKKFGKYNHGNVENVWNVNGIKIEAFFWWHSESNEKGDNEFYLLYYTNASASKEIKPNDDL